MLHRAAEAIRERNHELSVLESLDTGKPLQETLVADAASGADCLEYFAGLIAADTGQYIDLGSSFAYTRREPLGVCAAIGAWNYPIQIACWKAAPALAAGNSMVFKPSELTPLSALALAEILVPGRSPRRRLQRRAGRGRRRRRARVAPGGGQGLGHRLGADGGAGGARRRRGPQARDARARRQVTVDRVRRRRSRQRRLGGDARQLLLDRAGVLERHACVRAALGARRVPRPARRPHRADRARRPARRGDADGPARERTAARARARLHRRRPRRGRALRHRRRAGVGARLAGRLLRRSRPCSSTSPTRCGSPARRSSDR